MATPIVSITSPKTVYNNDETMEFTVTWTDGDAETLTFTGSVTDAAGNVGTATMVINIQDPANATASSVPARTWTKVSQTANSATFRAVA